MRPTASMWDVPSVPPVFDGSPLCGYILYGILQRDGIERDKRRKRRLSIRSTGKDAGAATKSFLLDGGTGFQPVDLTMKSLSAISVAFILLAAIGNTAGDVVVFKDGRRFRCRVLETPDESASGDFRIESQGSILWIKNEYVGSFQQDDTDEEADQEEIQQLLRELIEEGRIVPSLTPQIQFAPKPKPPVTQVSLEVSDLRGWAYLSQKDAGGTGGRSRLIEGDPVPPGYVVEVSPNSRLRLNLGKAATLGLNAGSRLQILSVSFEQDTFVYRFEVDLVQGTLWVDVQSLGELRKLKLINRGAQIFLNRQLISFRASPGGGMEAVPLTDPIAITAAGGQRVPKVSPGERWISRPGGTEIQPAPDWNRDLKVWQQWDAWQPETLEMEWNPALPSLELEPVLKEVHPVFPWEIPVDSSFVSMPDTRSLPEVMGAFLDGVQAYHGDTKTYPSQTEWIDSLLKDPGVSGWNGPYISADLPRVDLWGRPFIYEVFRHQDQVYLDVRSRGPNGEDDRGLNDDIRLGRKQ